MRFIDEATIRTFAGHGGPGCVAFRREKYIPRGGPAGGDGGRGGDIIFVADSNLSTLQDFRFRRLYRADPGESGGGSNKNGRDGVDIRIRIPVGTTIRDAESGEVLIDFTDDGQEWIACKGGRGGKGNTFFKSATHQAPKFAQPGEEGDAKELRLELKLLADVGIIGYPNAGKSTLISRISAARPKIADYAFTTLTPNLGVVYFDEYESCVVADIPGLIEGAHAGAGLGIKFLKHIERTRLFLHLLDGARLLDAASNPWDETPFQTALEAMVREYRVIRQELAHFDPKLLHKPEIVVLNKVDLVESAPDLIEKVRLALRDEIAKERKEAPQPEEPIVISSATGKNLDGMLNVLRREHNHYAPPKKKANPDAPYDPIVGH